MAELTATVVALLEEVEELPKGVEGVHQAVQAVARRYGQASRSLPLRALL